jgi:hypothetical protein
MRSGSSCFASDDAFRTVASVKVRSSATASFLHKFNHTISQGDDRRIWEMAPLCESWLPPALRTTEANFL